MIGLLSSLIPGLFKLGDKLIVDKDKKAEYAFKVQEMMFRQMEIMLNVKTYPWVDGLVKLSYASETIIKGLFRPLGAACLTGFAIYADIYDIEISEGIEYILYGAFPAWGASRHVEKSNKAKNKKYEVDIDDDYDF